MATKSDIVENRLNIDLIETDVSTVSEVLGDVDYGITNSYYALNAKLDKALIYESAESPYVNIICVREENRDIPMAKALAAAALSKEVADFFADNYKDCSAISVVENPTNGYDASVDYSALAGQTVKIVTTGDLYFQVLEIIKTILAAKDINLEIVIDDEDYITPILKVDSGEAFAHFFAYAAFQNDFNEVNNTNLVGIAGVFVEPMGLYAGQKKTLQDLNGKDESMALISANSANDGDWTCPTCGRINNDDMNFCGNCRTEKPKMVYSIDSNTSNAWVCSNCSHICPEEDNFCTKCGTDHNNNDLKAVMVDKPKIEALQMSPCFIERIPYSFTKEGIAVYYTANTDGMHYFWLEDKPSDLYAKIVLYDRNNEQLRGNEIYSNDPGIKYRLTAGENYRIVLKNGYDRNSTFTLCIGAPRNPEQVNVRCIIQDSMDYYYQENTYIFAPEIAGKYRLDVTEMQNGQEIDITIQDELGYTVKSSNMGMSMGNGLSFEAEGNKLYYIIAKQRTSLRGKNLGSYKIQLSSPNPILPINGCNAIGDYLYYQGQINTYEFVAPETGNYSLFFAFTDATCNPQITVVDEYGYKMKNNGKSSYYITDLTAGNNYRIMVEQLSGMGNYSLFIQKNE